MDFTLFTNIHFTVSDPILLIESYCVQSDFFINYDMIRSDRERNIFDINKIGGRTSRDVLMQCSKIINNSSANMTSYTLDSFLQLNIAKQQEHIHELDKQIVAKLLNVRGIGLSKVTKILHTLFPEIFPMIDNPLQKKYKTMINPSWNSASLSVLFVEFYKNFMIDKNKSNIDLLHKQLSHLNLTKIRLFDIIWWSYMKSQSPERKDVKWRMIG